MRDEMSTSVPCNIWFLRDAGTMGAFNATAEGGMGAGVAVEREYEGGGGGLEDTGLGMEGTENMGLIGGAPSAAGAWEGMFNCAVGKAVLCWKVSAGKVWMGAGMVKAGG